MKKKNRNMKSMNEEIYNKTSFTCKKMHEK